MRRRVLLTELCSVVLLLGCGQSNESSAPSAPPAEPAQNAASEADVEQTTARPADLPAPKTNTASADRPSVDDAPAADADPARDAETTAPVPTDHLQLEPDLGSQQLLEFLANADRAMRDLANGASSAAEYQQAVPELKRLASLKQEAAERLAEQAADSPNLLKKAKRGRLQALSHLAAMGDLKAAEELERYARELAASADPALAVEGRLVLIGFSLEQLQSGASEDPDDVVQLVTELAKHPELLDMPALMAIAQARAVLQQYGYESAAEKVRDLLVTAFSDHADPQIVTMAQQMAGTARFDRLDALRRSIESGEFVTLDQWTRAARQLVNQHPDRATLQYLATAALALESEGKNRWAEATYDVLQSELDDADDPALLEELRVITESYAARQQIIGEPLEINMPDLQGESIDWSSYRGKVVLVPFWAAEYPDSVSLFPLLEQIRAIDPDRIAILGVNLDVQAASAAAFASQFHPDWPSARSGDASTRGAMHPLAQKVGLASMPFVVVVNPNGNVAAISMTGDGLEETVRDLL